MSSGFGINHSVYAAREKWLKAEQARHEEARKAAEAPGRAEEIEKWIESGVDASPDGIVLIVGKDHLDNKPGSPHASHLPSFISSKTWDHAAIAYRDKETGDIVFIEKTPSQAGLWSKNYSGTIKDLAKYTSLDVVALNLTRDYGPGARDRFVKGATDAVHRNYSFLSPAGDTCSSAFMAGMMEARSKSFGGVMENVSHYALKFGHWFTALFNTYTPTDAWVEARSHSVPLGVDMRAAFEIYDPAALALSSDAMAISSHEDRASRQAATSDEEGASPSKQVATASDDENARGDDAAQQAEADDDEEASQEEVELASDPEDARSDDAARQPETDDDEEASQEEVELASDPEDARTEDAAQQPKTDDDEDASQERAALVSDNEDAATDGVRVMETAKAEEAGVNSTGDDEAAAAPGKPATPASADMEEGFSFSMFAKQGIPVESDKDAVPAEQVSPAASSTSAMPGSDAAHPDVGSEDVGNAAPSKEPLVHHGDLAP
jgi:hypothetical protein